MDTRQWRWHSSPDNPHTKPVGFNLSRKVKERFISVVCLTFYAYPSQACTSCSHKSVFLPCLRRLFLEENEPTLSLFILFPGGSNHGYPLQDRRPADPCRSLQLESLPLSNYSIVRLLYDWIYNILHWNHGCFGLVRRCFRIPEHEHRRVDTDQSQRCLSFPSRCLLWFTTGLRIMSLSWTSQESMDLF